MPVINKILFITLSNIGDVILTLPSLDYLLSCFPQAEITVIVGPRPRQIFEGIYAIKKVIVYDKYSLPGKKKALLAQLRREKFDLIVDLRNSIFGWLLPAKFKTSRWAQVPKEFTHMQKRHLYKTQQAVRKTGITFKAPAPEKSFHITAEDISWADNIFKEHNIKPSDTVMVIAPGARSHTKRWSQEKFVVLIDALNKEYGAKVLLVGDHDDSFIAESIEKKTPGACIDLAGKTTLTQLAALMPRCSLLITNDSAVMHLGSYLDIPTVAIFGITDELKYGPWGRLSAVAKKNILCRPCQKAQCRLQSLECINLIKPQDILRQVRLILNPDSKQKDLQPKPTFQRILIVRTDRIGDVLLSTPAIKALRDAFPHAYIAMMVSPAAQEIVEGNPYLDQVIIYDKDGKHKSWLGSGKFSRKLQAQGFDAAFILHPTNRVHLVTFFAGIKHRIGFDRKMGFLLTERIPHTKQEGQKHEMQYTLDLLRHMGIEPQNPSLFMPIRKESEAWADEIFLQAGISGGDKVVGIHPGASCPSKLWPVERFRDVAQELIMRYNYKIVVVSGPRDIEKARVLAQKLQGAVLDCAGKTSLSQLASILRRCSLFISNDSGPVHMATALGTPVVSIFGRSQKGLSPRRWGPLGPQDRVVHKEVGCTLCLAHNCTKGFLCLQAITSQDVLEAAKRALKNL